jgi:FKBP-type peptidyl-prolyl cis-trans isomerase (trigger factor)
MSLFRKAPSKPSDSAAAGAASGTVTELAPCQKGLRLHVAPEAISPVRAAVVAEFTRQAALPGFRKGKAPVDLVQRQYGKDIQDETLHRVTRQSLEQVARDHRLKPVGPFEITNADFDDAKGLTLEARVEVEPDFALADYRGVPLRRPAARVGADDVDRALTQLQESMAQLVPVGEGQPKERKTPALDDELAKDLGYETLPKLRQHVEAKLREQQAAAQSAALERALCDALVERHGFEVPASLVAHQAERLQRDFKTRLLLSGMTEEQVGAEMGKFTDELRTSATRQVKLTFILDRIAEQEKVSVTQDELVKRLWQLSQRWNKDPAEVRKVFDEERLWPSVASAIRQEKTIALLLAASAVTDAPAEQPHTEREGVSS